MLREGSLSPAQAWGVAVASAGTARNRPLLDAIVTDALAASAINGCEICVQAHEKAVREAGLTEDGVHDAVRIAATIHAAAVALESAGVLATA